MFPIGSSVIIRPDSRFDYQIKKTNNEQGRVVRYSGPNKQWHNVHWPNGYQNDYQDTDLQLLGSTNRSLTHLLSQKE